MIRTEHASYIDVAQHGIWVLETDDDNWHHYQSSNGRYFKDGTACEAFNIETIIVERALALWLSLS